MTKQSPPTLFLLVYINLSGSFSKLVSSIQRKILKKEEMNMYKHQKINLPLLLGKIVQHNIYVIKSKIAGKRKMVK